MGDGIQLHVGNVVGCVKTFRGLAAGAHVLEDRVAREQFVGNRVTGFVQVVEFDEDGISKIVNSYEGDIKPLTDRLQAVLDAGEDYQTFTSVADGVNGSVKFIYKLDSIKTDDAK